MIDSTGMAPQWLKDLGKAVVIGLSIAAVTVACVGLSVVTFGAATPLALAVGVLAAGAIAGGVIGGVSAANNGGSPGQIVAGVFKGIGVGLIAAGMATTIFISPLIGTLGWIAGAIIYQIAAGTQGEIVHIDIESRINPNINRTGGIVKYYLM